MKSPVNRKVSATTILERKDPGLPVFVVIPGGLVARWKLAGTTVIEGTANGHAFGRRTLKAWGKGSDDWFVEFTAPFCKSAGLSVGAPIALQMWLADTSTPGELEVLLSRSKALSRAWSELTDRQKREASEHIRAAKTQATRERRARSVAGSLR